MISLSWYSTKADLKSEIHEPVSLDAAIEIALKYYSKAGKKYATDKETMAETIFGFVREKKIFVEFCINERDNIFCRFEMPQYPAKKPSWFELMFNAPVQHRFTLSSFEDVRRVITDFFTLELVAFREKVFLDMAENSNS